MLTMRLLQGLPISGNKQELIERLQAAVGSDLLDENDDDDLDQEEEQLSDEAIKKAEAELQAQGDGDSSFSEVADKTPSKDKNAAEVGGRVRGRRYHLLYGKSMYVGTCTYLRYHTVQGR